MSHKINKYQINKISWTLQTKKQCYGVFSVVTLVGLCSIWMSEMPLWWLPGGCKPVVLQLLFSFNIIHVYIFKSIINNGRGSNW